MLYKYIFTLLLLLVTSCQAYPENVPDLIPFHKDGKWGYLNKNRKVIISPKFQHAELFEDEFAFVRINDKSATIDRKGNFIISPEHDLEYGMPFREGLIPAKDPKSGLTGYMDKKGQWQIKPQFNRGFHFSNGVTAVVIDGGKNWVFINKQGKALSKPRLFIRGSDFYFGMHVFKARATESPTGWGHGVINRHGRVIVPPKYFQAHIINANLIQLLDGRKNGFVDSTGKEILPVKYDVKGAEEGYFAVSLDDKTGVMDSTGNFVIPMKYERLKLVGDGLALVVDSIAQGHGLEFHGHFINMKNEAVTSTNKFEGSPEKCKDGFCVTNQIRIDPRKPSMDFVMEYALINLKGERVAKEDYIYVDLFNDGLATVADKNSKAGFIDKTGKLVIKCQYDFALESGYHGVPRFRKGLCLVYRDAKPFYIDKAGNEYISD